MASASAGSGSSSASERGSCSRSESSSPSGSSVSVLLDCLETDLGGTWVDLLSRVQMLDFGLRVCERF